MIWIQEGSTVWRNQEGNPCSPLHAKGLPRKIRVKLTIAHADNKQARLIGCEGKSLLRADNYSPK